MEPPEALLRRADVLYPVVAGLDVHRDAVVVTIRKAQGRPKGELAAGYTPAPNAPSRVRYHIEPLERLGIDVSPLRAQAA